MQSTKRNVYIPAEEPTNPTEAYIPNLSSTMINNPFSEGLPGSPSDVKLVAKELRGLKCYTADMHDIFVETPPLALRYGSGIKHIYSTGRADALRLKPGMDFQMGDTDVYDWSTDEIVSWPPMYKPEQRNDYLSWDMDPDHRYLWNRTYYGIMGAAVVPGPKGDVLIAMTHGENKNATFGPPDKLIYSTTNIEEWGRYQEPARFTYPRPEPYEFDRVYYGMVGVACCPLSYRDGNALMDDDMGPALWPSAGYLDQAGNQICYGPRHPYAIVEGEYMYVYYIDDICTDRFPHPDSVEAGRMFGLKLARVPISDVRPENFRLYFQGQFDEPALPAGFDKFDRRFVYEKGGRGDILLAHPSGSPVVRFAVAKLEGTDLWVGLSYDRQQEHWLWVSKDMIHFSRQQFLGKSPFMYPVFYNQDFSSNTCIDPTGFYIGGAFVTRNEDGTEEPPQFAARYFSLTVE